MCTSWCKFGICPIFLMRASGESCIVEKSMWQMINQSLSLIDFPTTKILPFALTVNKVLALLRVLAKNGIITQTLDGHSLDYRVIKISCSSYESLNFLPIFEHQYNLGLLKISCKEGWMFNYSVQFKQFLYLLALLVFANSKSELHSLTY